MISESLIKLNVSSDEKGTSGDVPDTVTLNSIRITHEDSFSRVSTELRLKLGWDTSPAVGIKYPEVRQIWFAMIDDLVRGHCHR
jgi:hypothetical protein